MPDVKESFPSIPVTHWWKLRNKFQQSIPTTVTPGYIAAALNMKENSAKANVRPALIAFGIVDENGKPKDRAVKWRGDEEYTSVCEEIRKEIYPKELLEALPPPTPDRDSVERWFANRTGSGKGAVGKMTTSYLLLCEADPSKTQGIPKKTPSSAKKKKPASPPPKVPATTKPITSSVVTSQGKEKVIPQITPSIHIDIQVHISPDATVDQIDQIFASMAKHLYKRENE